MTLYYLKYNNYYNRIVKQESDIDAYKNYLITDESNNVVPSATVENVAFDFGDGVNTTHILKNWPYAIPDYLVITDDYGINSRWFIIDAKSTRKYGQYEISLRRDLMVDFYESFINSPAYIERGIINVENSLIYNKEGLSVNQIKTDEILLKDKTNTPWVVAYIARNDNNSGAEITEKTVKTNAYVSTAVAEPDAEYSIEKLKNLGVVVGDLLQNTWGDFVINLYTLSESNITSAIQIHSDGTNNNYSAISGNNITAENAKFSVVREEVSQSFKEFWDDNINDINSLFYGETEYRHDQSLINYLNSLSGKLLKDTLTDTLYTINVKNTYREVSVEINPSSGLYGNYFVPFIETLPRVKIDNDGTNNSVTVVGQFHACTVEVVLVPGKEISMTIPKSGERLPLVDAPWDMLAIPLNAGLKFFLGGATVTSEANVALSIAQALPLAIGKDNIYDIQLLPYCPCPEYIRTYDEIELYNATEGIHYTRINDVDGTTVTVGLWVNISSFNAQIALPQSAIDRFTPSSNPIEFKVQNECDMYRLVSPNYSGAFEFSATKNDGIFGFEANCTYKPLQPYIHVNPRFSGLYGQDFNDNRGLICSGNFSLPTTSSAWTDYQVQNKSFKDSFDRQIQNMEDVYELQIQQQKINSVLGGISGVISGAGTGAMMGAAGGPWGALAGGMIGAGTSLMANTLGAAADLHFAQQAQDLALSYTKDQWDLSLQNIKALPNTLSNIGAFDADYKYYPFLEYYTCTDREKDALRNKIKYNGMTINAIDIINNYVYNDGSYISAQLIRITDLDEDYHVAAEIASELHRGIYI